MIEDTNPISLSSKFTALYFSFFKLGEWQNACVLNWASMLLFSTLPIGIDCQWRRQDFFSGGTPRPLKGYHAPPAGGPGAKAPRTVSKFHFLKRCNEMNRVFKNIKIFLPKTSIFHRNFWIFSNTYLKIFNFNETYKYREIFGEFYYLIEKFMTTAQKIS